MSNLGYCSYMERATTKALTEAAEHRNKEERYAISTVTVKASCGCVVTAESSQWGNTYDVDMCEECRNAMVAQMTNKTAARTAAFLAN